MPKLDFSDCLVVLGALLVVAATVPLAGPWWALGLLGLLMALAGLLGGG